MDSDKNGFALIVILIVVAIIALIVFGKPFLDRRIAERKSTIEIGIEKTEEAQSLKEALELKNKSTLEEIE